MDRYLGPGGCVVSNTPLLSHPRRQRQNAKFGVHHFCIIIGGPLSDF